jgi:hypothetical protein
MKRDGRDNREASLVPGPLFTAVSRHERADGGRLDVRPDHQAEEVEQDRRAHAAARRILDRAPKPLPKPMDPETATRPIETGASFTELERALVLSISDLLRQHWCEARATEIGVSEIAEEFDGEDPLKPDTRALLDGCVSSCRKLRDDMADSAEIELPEPGEDDVAQVRLLIDQVAEA